MRHTLHRSGVAVMALAALLLLSQACQDRPPTAPARPDASPQAALLGVSTSEVTPDNVTVCLIGAPDGLFSIHTLPDQGFPDMRLGLEDGECKIVPYRGVPKEMLWTSVTVTQVKPEFTGPDSIVAIRTWFDKELGRLVTSTQTILGTREATATLRLLPSEGWEFVYYNSQPVTSPASLWMGLKSEDDPDVTFDLLAEVLKNGEVLNATELDGISGGGSSFPKAVLQTIGTTVSSATGYGPGDALGLRLSIRLSGGVSVGRSSIARIWYGSGDANSSFQTVVNGSTRTFFLIDGFQLSSTLGTGPRKMLHVKVDKNADGNPFQPFGTWSITF